MKTTRFDRRAFLAKTGKAGVAITAATAGSLLLFDSEPPLPGLTQETITGLPDFSVPHGAGNTLSIAHGRDRKKTVNTALKLLGGIERFIKPGETVAIKPNVAFATPPILGATTNNELVAEVVRLCYRQGRAKKVIVLDNPINDPASCFALSGIGQAAESAGARIVMPRENLFAEMTLAGGKLIRNWPVFLVPFENVDKLIGIAPVKHHSRSGASMTMKNWYGLLGGRRNIFHQDINTIISELARMVTPTFVILDGTDVMMSNGPTGGSISDLRQTDTVIVSCDQVAADAYGASLLGMKVRDLPYLALAEKAGLGTSDYTSLQPITAPA
ncbi:MAG: DUF362 domain-containing protein [Thermodesulfobacteriota bacterium]|nr:DUF362 domain-containing protein [Thermodesulfobacteriota bacterium]